MSAAEFGSSEAASEAGKKGGRARADALTPEQRSEIARRAVEARWGAMLRATHTGTLKLGDIELACAVLNDKDHTRVISERGFMAGLNIKYGGALALASKPEGGAAKLPMYVGFKSLRPFVDEDLAALLQNPIRYRLNQGGNPGHGLKAILIPKVCNVWLRARDANALTESQKLIAARADILMRGLAEVGIVAMVDEATGFQDMRARDALAKILEAFVAKELRKWVKTFPPDYFKEMCRLKGKPFSVDMKLPRYFGVHTNDVVYSRLAPGVLAELRTKNPTTETGRRKHKNFQWLTEDVGNPKLLQHLAAVIALMKASPDWDGFKLLIDRALPKYQSLPLLDGNEYDTE